MNVTLAFEYFLSLLATKKSIILVSLMSSITLNTLLDKAVKELDLANSILPIIVLFTFSFLTGVFIIADLITGIRAARSIGDTIKADKWGITVGKMFGLILYCSLASLILLLVSSNYFVSTMVIGPVILTIIKEYLSVGENIEKTSGKALYMFSVVHKIFDVLESRFFASVDRIDIKNKINKEE